MVCEDIASNGRLVVAKGPSSISLVLEVLIFIEATGEKEGGTCTQKNKI